MENGTDFCAKEFFPEEEKFGMIKCRNCSDAKEETTGGERKNSVAKQNEEEKILLNAVLSNVAAQMRGPLSVLHTSAQKLLRQEIPGAAQLNQSYYQLVRLAGNLSAAEVLASGSMRAVCMNGDIVDFCRTLMERLEPLAAKKKVQVVFACAEKEHVAAFDAYLLERLLLNLISNALKFTPEGGRIVLSLRFQKQHIFLEVEDNGCGIAEDKMDTLFDRYLHSERMDPEPYGLGLGLPVCRAIAQAHHGRILAQSQVGEGTKITVILPDETSALQRVRDAAFDYAGGFDHILVELSDALSAESYDPKNL